MVQTSLPQEWNHEQEQRITTKRRRLKRRKRKEEMANIPHFLSSPLFSESYNQIQYIY